MWFSSQEAPINQGQTTWLSSRGLTRQREPPIWSQVVRGLRVLSLEPEKIFDSDLSRKKTQLSRSFSQRVSENPWKNDAKGRRSFFFLGRKTQFQGFFLNFRRCIEKEEKNVLRMIRIPPPQKKTSSTPFPKTTSAEKMGFTRYIRVYQITCFFSSGNYCSPFSGGFR